MKAVPGNARIKKALERFEELLRNHFGTPPRNSQPVTPLTVLIGTILSQNTNDRNSYRAYTNLVNRFPSWQEAADAAQGVIEELIRPAGLITNKGAAIRKVLSMVYHEHALNMAPEALSRKTDTEIVDTLTAIDGVGVKTAACVLLFALDRNVCPVDTHVHRVFNRAGLVAESTPEKTFRRILPCLPAGRAHALHTNTIRLGREFCLPANPACAACPVNSACKFPQKNSAVNRKFVKKDFMLLDSL